MTPSNANTSGLDHFGWWVEHTVAEPMFIRPPAFCPASDNYTITPLVTAASAQARIAELSERIGHLQADFDDCNLHRTAAEARADRLAGALANAEETARRYARCYPPESDGRNTFLMLADHIAALQEPTT